jgi:hypothetical protein
MKKRNPHGDDIHYFKASHVSGYSGYRRNKSIDVDVDQFQKAVGVNPFMRPPSHVTRTLARGNVWRQRFNEAGDGKQLTKSDFKQMLAEGDRRMESEDISVIAEAVSSDSNTVRYKDWSKYLNKYKRKEHSITPSTDYEGMKETMSKSAWGASNSSQQSSRSCAKKAPGRFGTPARGPPQGVEYATATRMFQGRTRGQRSPWVTTSEAFNNNIYENLSARANNDKWFTTTQKGWQPQGTSRPSLDMSMDLSMNMSMHTSMNTTVARPMSANSRFLTTNQQNSMRIYGGLL